MNTAKVVALLAWLALVPVFFIPGDAVWLGWCQISFWILTATHAIDFMVFNRP